MEVVKIQNNQVKFLTDMKKKLFTGKSLVPIYTALALARVKHHKQRTINSCRLRVLRKCLEEQNDGHYPTDKVASHVEFRDAKSGMRKFKQGVSQCAVLSPTFFNLYIFIIFCPSNN